MREREQELFTNVKVGPYTLDHRVVMAPLTRLRSDQPGDVPNDLMAEYYPFYVPTHTGNTLVGVAG